MYTLSNRFKIFSLSLIILGSLGWFYSYTASHLTLDEVKVLIAEESHHGSYSDDMHNMSHQNENITMKILIMGMKPMGMRMSMLNMFYTKYITDHMRHIMLLPFSL